MNVTRHQINQIIEKCAWAPSGDNCQPWTFEWDGETLAINHSAGPAGHPLDPGGTASLLSLGCLLHAIDLAASDFHFTTSFTLKQGEKPNQPDERLWARVQFLTSDRPQNPLSEVLRHRSTDRRLYKGGELNSEMLREMSEQQNSFAPARMHILPKPNQRLVKYIIKAEELLLDHSEILPATLNWVRFTMNQARKTRDGMLWRNMEIRFWELPMVPILRDIPQVLNILGPILRSQNRIRVKRQLESSAGLVCISIPTIDTSNVVQAGRLMMGIWLSLNQQGYGVQPFTISSMIALCAKYGVIELPKKWTDFFREGEIILRQEFSIPLGTEPIWMIRTGRSTPLPENSRTFRKSLEAILRIRS